MNLRRTLGPISLVTLALALGACSSSSSKSSSSGSTASTKSASNSKAPTDICAAISSAKAAEILGGAVDAPSPASAPSKGCSWSLTNGKSLSDGLTILMQDGYVFDGGRAAQKNSEVQQQWTYQDVSGVGDDAYFQTAKGVEADSIGSTPILLVKSGGKTYNISVRLKGESDQTLKDKDLAAAKALLNG